MVNNDFHNSLFVNNDFHNSLFVYAVGKDNAVVAVQYGTFQRECACVEVGFHINHRRNGNIAVGHCQRVRILCSFQRACGYRISGECIAGGCGVAKRERNTVAVSGIELIAVEQAVVVFISRDAAYGVCFRRAAEGERHVFACGYGVSLLTLRRAEGACVIAVRSRGAVADKGGTVAGRFGFVCLKRFRCVNAVGDGKRTGIPAYKASAACGSVIAGADDLAVEHVLLPM